MKKKKNPESPQIISQSAAAEIADTPRQSINNLFKSGNSRYQFFTEKGKVDTSHPDWKIYLRDRKEKESKRQGSERVMKSVDNDLMGLLSPKTEKQSGNGSEDDEREKWSREHALTGGYNPAVFYPTSTAQLKNLTDITRMNLEMRIKLGDLMDRAIVDSYIEKIAQGVMQFVNLGRTVSSQICQKLDRIGMEKEVEKVISPKVKNIIEQVIKSCTEIVGRDIEVKKVRKKGKAAGRKKK